MDIDVKPEGAVEDDESSGKEPTPFSNLAELHAEITAKLRKELEVPFWREQYGYPVFVAYKVPNMGRLARSAENRGKQNADDKEILVHCDTLVNACIEVYGVYYTQEGEEQVEHRISLAGADKPFTRFDDTLAVALGMPEASKAVEVCRKLYFSDAAITVAAGLLIEWAAGAQTEADRSFLGS